MPMEFWVLILTLATAILTFAKAVVEFLATAIGSHKRRNKKKGHR